MDIETTVLNSSALKAAVRKGSDLLLIFKDGATYAYPGKADHYEPICNAESAGRYMNKHLYKYGVTAESYAL